MFCFQFFWPVCLKSACGTREDSMKPGTCTNQTNSGFWRSCKPRKPYRRSVFGLWVLKIKVVCFLMASVVRPNICTTLRVLGSLRKVSEETGRLLHEGPRNSEAGRRSAGSNDVKDAISDETGWEALIIPVVWSWWTPFGWKFQCWNWEFPEFFSYGVW